jgi:hypothetical protein
MTKDNIPDFLDEDYDSSVHTIREPVIRDYKRSAVAKELIQEQYLNIFERVLEGLARGLSVKEQTDNDYRIKSYEAFLAWIKRDPMRNERYKAAQEIRTERMALEILEIADGLPDAMPEDVARSKLRIDSRKFLMGCWNRSRYGEIKTVELGGTISITTALEQARNRVISAEIIDVEPKEED